LKIDINLPDKIGKGYASFWRARKRYRVLKGGRASKKSTTASLWFIYNIMKYPLANVLVVRKTFNTHKDSTYAQLKWAARRLDVSHLWKFTLSPLEAIYRPTGQKILFRGFDDPLKLTSMTVDIGVLCWVWIEEAYEIDDEEEFNTLDESIRGEMPEGYWKQLTLTFNPWIMTHWTKTRFFDNDDPDAFTLTTTYKCNEWLDDADRRKIEDLEIANPDRFKVVGLGEYGLPGGQYYDEWRRDIHVFNPAKLILPPWWKRFRSLDYGLDCTACYWWAVSTDRRLFIYRELYRLNLTLSQAAAAINDLTGPDEHISYTVASPDLWNRRQDSGVPGEETMRKAGLSGLVRADDSRVNGWRQLREYLTPYDDPESGAKTANLLVGSNCIHLIRTLPALVHDDHDVEDVSDKCEDHGPESVRYGVMSRPPASVEPAEQQRRKNARQKLTRPVVSSRTGY
jgi:phage terminase large subunit